MAARTLPGLGLVAYWEAGENNWKDGMDLNLLKLSVLSQLSVVSATVALPGAATNGMTYIVPTGGADAGKIAVRDNGAWVMLTPIEGFLAYVRDTDKYMTFDGLAWADLATGGGSGGDGLEDAPSDGNLYGRKDAAWQVVPAASAGAVPILSAFIGGKTTANEVLFRFLATTAMTFAEGNARAKAGIAATAQTTFTINYNGASRGTIVFAAGATTGVVDFTSDIAMAVDGVLSIVGPATPDATLADIAISFQGA